FGRDAGAQRPKKLRPIGAGLLGDALGTGLDGFGRLLTRIRSDAATGNQQAGEQGKGTHGGISSRRAASSGRQALNVPHGGESMPADMANTYPAWWRVMWYPGAMAQTQGADPCRAMNLLRPRWNREII